jgi:signal transduction histidine kinase
VRRLPIGLFASLRSRLIVTYFAIVLVSVTAAAAYTTTALRGFILDLIARNLLSQAQLVADDVRVSLYRGDHRAVSERIGRADAMTAARVLVLDARGEPRGTTADPAPVELRPTDARIAAALAGRMTVSTSVDSATPNERVQATVPVFGPGDEVIGAVRASYTLEDVNGTMGHVNTATLVGAVGAAVAAGVVGLFLAGQVARPVRQVARAATALATDGRGPRLAELRSGPSEVRALVSAFDDLAERLAAFERARNEFASDISHELHSLASAMQTAAEALDRGAYAADPAVGALLVHGLVGHTRRLGRLAEDLRGLARLEGGRLALELEDVDLGELLRDVRNEWLAEADQRGITIVLHTPPGALPLRADGVRLVQAIGNLVENALKYAGSGGRVELLVGWNAVDGQYEVAVRDSGPGIPEEVRARVFERYFRIEGRVGAGAGGMGLGLAIAYGIARAHGGDLSVESPPDGGARFVLRIPTAACEKEVAGSVVRLTDPATSQDEDAPILHRRPLKAT